MQAARAQSEATGETAHVYTAARYAARTWGHERRVVIKAEVVRLGERAPRDNPRVVVTNLRQTPRFIYERVLLCSRRHRAPDQGVARWPADRPHELLPVLGQPTARLADRRSLRADAGAAIAGGAYCVCPQPGDVAAQPAAEAGGPRRPLGPPRGAASAARHATPRGVAAHRARAGRARRIAHPLRRAPLRPGRHGPLRQRGCRCPTLASVMPPRSAAQTPAPLAGADVRDPFLRRSRPLGGRIWTFTNNAG